MRRTFRDDDLQARFERDGYVVVEGFLTADEVQALRDAYFARSHDLGHGFHATMHSRMTDYRRAVSGDIASVFTPKADDLLDDYRQLVSNYTVKEPGPESFFDFHLDWNMVDERASRSVTIWCPLEDTNARNGNLWVLEESHTLPDSYRCGPGLALLFDEAAPFAHRRFKKRALPMRAGDAIIYDHKLFHGSPPNLTDAPRLAINQAMCAADVETVHYRYDPSTREMAVHVVDDDFYHRCLIGDGEAPNEPREVFGMPNDPVEQEVVNGCVEDLQTES